MTQTTDYVNTPRVLIVDDMMVNRTILASMLDYHGIGTDLAECGQECIDLCRKNEYDLILLDHRMPDMDGVDTLLVLKDIFKESGHEIPVICHTTEEGKNNINLYKAAGFADVLIKPIDPGVLAGMLMKYIPGVREEASEAKEEQEHEEHVNAELEQLPSWVIDVSGLDPASGIERCGTAADYMDALKIFASSINERADEIEQYNAGMEREMYIAKMGSLYSIAALVGADSIAERASKLEQAAKDSEHKLPDEETSDLLREYRGMLEHLKPLIVQEEPPVKKKNKITMYATVIGQPVLFIGEDKGIVSKGIIKSLSDIGFKIISIRDELEEIDRHKREASLILYYPTGDVIHIKHIANRLAEISRDENKTLCLTGEPLDISSALKSHDSHFVSAVYPRPVDHEKLTTEMKRFATMQTEYNRIKNVLLIDDDTDFLKIIASWLEQDYDIDCASSDKDAMYFLKYTVPDLVVLDDELQGLSGLDIMQKIRDDSRTKRVPIIILSEKNDRETVMKILLHKPDGYLLKSMPKESLLEAIDRFFVGSILQNH